MEQRIQGWALTASRLARFALHVVARFYRRRGLLLAGAVAYNVLLSIVPLGALVLVALSYLVERDSLVRVFAAELEQIFPGGAGPLVDEIARFLEHSDVFGWLSLAFLLFFASLAFRVLGEAIAAIFADVRRTSRNVRGFWMSAVIPFIYVGVVVTGLLGVAVASSLLERYEDRSWTVLGLTLSLDLAPRLALYAGALVGELLMFTSVYVVLPGVGVRFRQALVGGLTATVLWEAIRRLLVWYFVHVSTIGLVYGSLTTVVVLLMSAEIAAVILLLGAQVIAELEYASLAGLRWHELPARHK